MKFNIANPKTGQQKTIEIDDESKFGKLFDKKMGQEFDGALLGDDYKGYVFEITGGIDRDGFAMKQGVIVKGRVRLLLDEHSKCYRALRAGERKRRSVRGCILGPDLQAIALKVIKKGDKEIEKLTDQKLARRLGPKRANKIRKLYKIPKHSDKLHQKKVQKEAGKKEPEKTIAQKGDKQVKSVDPYDVCQYVIKRITKEVGGKKFYKAPRIQRLVTPQRIRRKKLYRKQKKEAAERTKQQIEQYHNLLTKLREEKKKLEEKRAETEAQAKEPKKDDKKLAPTKSAETKKHEAHKKGTATTTTTTTTKTSTQPKTTEAPKGKETKQAPIKATEPKKTHDKKPAQPIKAGEPAKVTAPKK